MTDGDIELIDEFDGEIGIKDLPNQEGAIVSFVHPEYGFRLGIPLKFMPRKNALLVKIQGLDKRFEVDKEHLRFAFIGSDGDYDKFKVAW